MLVVANQLSLLLSEIGLLLVWLPQAMEVHMWRCVGPQKVWYEWAVASPHSTHIHNVSGRSYHVGL